MKLIHVILQVGERLGRLNVEKQKAIEIEDYDLAMVKKVVCHCCYIHDRILIRRVQLHIVC
jgi:hypothetical protein